MPHYKPYLEATRSKMREWYGKELGDQESLGIADVANIALISMPEFKELNGPVLWHELHQVSVRITEAMPEGKHVLKEMHEKFEPNNPESVKFWIKHYREYFKDRHPLMPGSSQRPTRLVLPDKPY